MSNVIDAAVAALAEKLDGQDFDGTAKFVIEDEGAIMVDGTGVHAGDGDADVTMTASQDVFESMMSGDLNPTAAFMSGKLAIDGDMGAAMKLGAVLA